MERPILRVNLIASTRSGCVAVGLNIVVDMSHSFFPCSLIGDPRDGWCAPGKEIASWQA